MIKNIIIILTLILNSRPAESASANIKWKTYPTENLALMSILGETHPEVIGFGEFHQNSETANVQSSIKRFSKSFIPLFGLKMSDLIIETWYPPEGCDSTREVVSNDIEETIDRPEETENELEILVRNAIKYGIKPHILEFSCDDYKALLATDTTEIDYAMLMAMIPRKIEALCSLFINNRGDSLVTRNIIAIYGGALHNDVKPEEMWKDATFAPKMAELTKGKYIEIDLYVPEYIENDEEMKKEKWFPIFKKNCSRDKILVIKPAPKQYVVILRKGVRQ